MKTSGGLTERTSNNMAQSGVTTLKGYLQAMMPEIKKALPTVMTPERFTRIVMTTISTNPALQNCSPQSFLGAVMQAAQLGVEPNTPLGQAYLIPYGNQVQFQLGYKGLIDLAYRSGEIQSIQAHEVYENDTFEYELGLEPKLKHIPALANRGKVILYYAVIKFKNGGECFEVMSREGIEGFAKAKSKTYSHGPWQTDFDEMAKKTILKRVLKYAPMKTEFLRAVSTDETVKSSVSEHMADLPDETITIDAKMQGNEKEKGEITIDKETGEVK